MSFWKTYEMAIDFGSSNMRVSIKGKGIVFNEPSVIAINTKTKKVIAIGHKAKNIVGREHKDVTVIYPIKKGVINDHKAASLMIHYIISVHCKGSLLKPIVMVSVPNDLTQMDKKSYISVFSSAGAKKVHLIPSPISTAMGNGVNITNPSGRLIVNFGGGICEISIITLGTVAVYSKLDIGSIDFDKKILEHLKINHKILIGDITAEKIKTTIGNVSKLDEDEFFAVKGKNLITGLPSIARISANELTYIFTNEIEKIADEITSVVTKAPAELAADILQYGIIIAGNGSLIKGFKELIDNRCGFKSTMSSELLLSTITGTLKATEQKQSLQKTGIL